MPEVAKLLGIASNMLHRWKDHIETQLEVKTLSMDEGAIQAEPWQLG